MFTWFGFEHRGIIFLWPWKWRRNNWHPCYSLDFGCACWPWQHWKMRRDYKRLYMGEDK